MLAYLEPVVGGHAVRAARGAREVVRQAVDVDAARMQGASDVSMTSYVPRFRRVNGLHDSNEGPSFHFSSRMDALWRLD